MFYLRGIRAPTLVPQNEVPSPRMSQTPPVHPLVIDLARVAADSTRG